MPVLPVPTLIPNKIKENTNKPNVANNNLTGLHPVNDLLKTRSYKSIIFGKVCSWKCLMAFAIKYLFATTNNIKKMIRLPKKVAPMISNTNPKPIGIQKDFFLKMADFGSLLSCSSWFIKSTAKTGFMIKATTKEAAKVNINMAGKYTMNLPMIPGQNNNGKNGAKVVTVPANTGMNTSPAAILAEVVAVNFPLPCTKIRCVFSITTIASSTIIPNPNSKANNTMKFKVILVPINILPAGKNTKATNILNGTDKATKKALVTPIKNINTINTKTNPITIEFTNSVNEDLVLILWSPVITVFKSLGKLVSFASSTIFLTASEVSIKFSPLRLMIFNVKTFFPSKRAKLSFFLTVSTIVATSFK